MFASSPFPLDAGEVRRPRGPSPVRALLLLLTLPAAIFAGIVVYAHVTAPSKASLSPAPPSYHGHLVWADGDVIFAHQKEVAAWLRQHGGKYPVFTKRHPVATKLVTPVKRRPAAKHVTPVRHVKPKPARTHAARVTPPPPTSTLTTRWGGLGTPGVVIVLGIAVLLLLLAIAPPSLLHRVGLSRLNRDRDLRWGAAGASVAIVAGIAVVTLVA